MNKKKRGKLIIIIIIILENKINIIIIQIPSCIVDSCRERIFGYFVVIIDGDFNISTTLVK